MPRFTPCSSSPAPGASSSTNTSTIPATATSDWPTPTVSTSTTSKPAASHTSIASRVRRATPPSVPPDGDGRMNASRSSRQLLHARLVAEDRAAAARARRIDREHRDPWPASTRCRPSASMNVDFPAPGAPLIPTRTASPGRGQQLVEQRDRVVAVIGARRLDERDRPRRARAGRRRAPRRRASRDRRRSSRRARRSRTSVEDLRRGARDVAARARTPRRHRRRAGTRSRRPGSRRRRRRRCRARPAPAAPRSSCGHERLVPGGLARDADDVHVVLDRVARGFLGRLEQRADVDVEAEVGERGRDDLGAAVVAVLAELGDEDARPAALRPARTSSTSLRMRWNSSSSAYAPPYTPEIVRIIGAVAAEHLLRARRRSRRPSRGRATPRSTARAGCRRLRRPRVSASSAASTRCGSRSPCTRSSRAICWRRTSVLSMSRTSIGDSFVEPVLVDADDRLLAAVDRAPGAAPRLPRCAASACPTRRPSSCRRAPRPPRSASTPRWRALCGQRLDVVRAAERIDRRG